ncbi:MAG: hypothetical protein RIQ93_3178 [Verrucomicrobiota bacterium]|jgi:hypothetical protein
MADARTQKPAPARSQRSATTWSLPAFVAFQAGFSVLNALALFFMLVTFHPVENVYAIVLGRTTTGLVISSLLHWLYQQPWISRRRPVAKWLGIIALNLAVSLFASAIWVILINWGGLPELQPDERFVSLTISRLFHVLIWNSMYFSIQFFRDTVYLKRDAAEFKIALQMAELKQLQAQLNPHFLFNALNVIKARLSAADAAATADVTQNLADYLRFTLQPTRKLEPLSRELEALDLYFKIQRARFQSGLDCSMSINQAALNVSVPPMLLQPLLENAFKYGPLTSASPFVVQLTAIVENGRLIVAVTNSGRWVEAEPGKPPGTGLDNLRRRLALLLGEDTALRIEKGSETVTAQINLPARGPQGAVLTASTAPLPPSR